MADVIRAADGPLASVRGEKPEDLRYEGSAQPLATVWIALRSSLREVLEQVTLADLAGGSLPAHVTRRSQGADAWQRR